MVEATTVATVVAAAVAVVAVAGVGVGTGAGASVDESVAVETTGVVATETFSVAGAPLGHRFPAAICNVTCVDPSVSARFFLQFLSMLSRLRHTCTHTDTQQHS